jgi:hypothetical protein
MLKMRMLWIALLAAIPVVALAQAPTVKVITGNPLTIDVASDGSFQVYNSAIPGSGQVFPTGSADGDMGIFAAIDGKLFAPAFTSHNGTATGNLGTYTAWQQGFISNVTGDGSGLSPFSVTVRLGAPNVDVAVLETVTYVSGLNYFRISMNWVSSSPHQVTAFLGADIYLASSDFGLFAFEPQLRAPGGTACDVSHTNYNILMIPITPASAFSDAFYGDLWKEISTQQLDNNVVGSACVDNAAALQWNNVFRGGTSAIINSAVSFGDIPPASAFAGFVLSLDPSRVAIFPGSTTTLTLTAVHNQDTGFNAPIALSAPNLPPGITMTFNPAVIPAPGDGQSTVTLSVSNDAFPQLYTGLVALGTAVGQAGDPEVHGVQLATDVICNPPFLLALPSSQPQSQVIRSGSSITLSVKNESAGGAKYQWYNGHTGFASSPIAGATSASWTSPAITSSQEYWVRVTNGCGSADSQTAVITVTP